jgi:predicted amidohydrolase YtcJ
VNTRALDLAGISDATPDPPDGRIERDSAGMPSGTLHEGAMRLVERLLPPDTPADLESALRLAQAYLHSLGITAWQDAWVTPEVLDAYRAVADRGELTARVVGALWWERDRGVEQIDELIERRARGQVGRFRATSVKIMLDGVLENFTGAVIEPYLDGHGEPTTNRGISFVDPEALKSHVARLDAAGFQVHFHAIGERAVREALDAVEAARRANGMSDRRHHIAHLQVVHPDDLPRFRALGVVANAQPLWAFHGDQMDELTIPYLGPERSGWQYPFGSLRRAGAALCMGSDWSVSSADPLLEIEVAVRRVGPADRDGQPFLPEERLDLPTALEAFTVGSAYVNHLDDVAGSLEVGKAADLVVLDRDLFDPDAGPPGDANVLFTLVGGEPVFCDPGLGA